MYSKVISFIATISLLLSISFSVQASMADFEEAYKSGDFETARKLLTDAARQGEEDAQSALGLAYFDGKLGLKRNLPEAIKWFKKSALQGNEISSFYLGQAEYSLGADYAESAKWFETSITQAENSPNLDLDLIIASNLWIGLLYLEGKVSEIDMINIYKWLYIGTWEAPSSLENTVHLAPTPEHMIKKLAPLMTPDQLESATKLAENWIAKNPR